jgi:hypothetical protein
MPLRSGPGPFFRVALALALTAPLGCHDRPGADVSHEAITHRGPVEDAPSARASAGVEVPDALAREVLAALEATPLAGKFHYDAGRFELVAVGVNVSLANLRIELDAAPAAERSGRIQRFVHAINEFNSDNVDFETARPDLVPVVRDRSYIEQFALTNTPGAAFQVVGENLAIAVAIDHKTSISTLGSSALAHWKTGFDQVMDVARENLRKASAKPFANVAPGVCASTWDDDYDGSRILLPEVLARCQVKGELVVAIPNRSLLLVTGADDPRALAVFADHLEEGAKSPRANATRAFRFTANTWSPFLPKGPPALERRFADFEIGARLAEYEQQKKLLEDKLAAEKKDIFVAAFSAFRANTGEAWSVATWARGVATYLPVTEYVIVGDPSLPQDKSILGRYALKDLRRVVPPSVLRPLGLWPERLATDGFPTADEALE